MTANYPILMSSMAKRNGTKADCVLSAIAALEAGKAAGSIANPAFVDAKNVLSRAIEDAWRATREPVEPYRNPNASEEAKNFAWSIAFVNGGIHGWHKTIQKRLATAPALPEVEPLVTAARAFVAEVAPIADLFAFFAEDKSRIVKRQPKANSDAEARFKAPAAATEATRQVKAMLETLVNTQFEALVAAFESRYRREIERFVKVRDEKVAEIAASDKPKRIYPLFFYARQNEGANINFLSKVLETLRDYREITPEVRADAEQIVAKTARDDAEEVRDFFVAKNLRKIVAVIEAKEKAGVAMTSCAPVAHTVSLGGLEGAFVVTFADGSGFRFSNSVVFKVTNDGRPYNQFPLTFHDVKLAGGVKMGRPSEERMNTVFLGKAEAA